MTQRSGRHHVQLDRRYQSATERNVRNMTQEELRSTYMNDGKAVTPECAKQKLGVRHKDTHFDVRIANFLTSLGG